MLLSHKIDEIDTSFLLLYVLNSSAFGSLQIDNARAISPKLILLSCIFSRMSMQYLLLLENI